MFKQNPLLAGSQTTWLGDQKCTLIAWVIGWAGFTYATAALRWLQRGKDASVLDTARGIFEIADAVPPYAKITFGVVFLLLLYALPRFGIAQGTIVTGTVAGGLAATVAMVAAPFDYFDGAAGSMMWREGIVGCLPHLITGVGAGATWTITRRRCERRTAMGR